MKAWHVILLLIGFVACFLTGYSCRGSAVENAIVRSDTVIVIDTIRDSIPAPVKEKPVGIIPAPDAIVIHDTVTNTDTIYVPIIQKEYATENYRAWVSGYNAALDSIDVFPKTVYITKRQPASRWGFGVTAGYGIGRNGLSPYIGIGGYYKIW